MKPKDSNDLLEAFDQAKMFDCLDDTIETKKFEINFGGKRQNNKEANIH